MNIIVHISFSDEEAHEPMVVHRPQYTLSSKVGSTSCSKHAHGNAGLVHSSYHLVRRKKTALVESKLYRILQSD